MGEGDNSTMFYLYETDVSKMNNDEFLSKSNFETESKIILIPLSCDARTVTYKYVKPAVMKDEEITFTIKVIPK